MNRLNHTALRRHSPRVTAITGAALGLFAGAAVYSSVSSSAEVPKPAASTLAKPPVAAAPASLAACAAGSKLENGVCVVRVVRRVVVPSAAGAAAPSAPSTSGAAAPSGPSGSTAAGAKPDDVAPPAAATAPRGDQAETPAASDTPSTSASRGEDAAATAQPSPKDAAALAAENAAALAARDAVQND